MLEIGSRDVKPSALLGEPEIHVTNALAGLDERSSPKNDMSAKHPELVQKAESYLQTRRLAAVPEWNFVKPDRQDD